MGGPDVRPIPLGVNSFSEIINGNYLFIDKTRLIRRMIKNYWFCYLYRPRRFGKTLLLDTLKHLFRGDEELFQKLWIGQNRHVWRKHPIIELDFNIAEPDLLTTKGFRDFLLHQIKRCGLGYELEVKGVNPSNGFEWLIDALYTKYGRGVVILVDNYDSPLTCQFKDKNQRKKNKRVMTEFLSKIVTIRFCVRFVLLAGQFRFPDRSLYPAVPRPFDLSFNKFFAPLCGVTSYELDRHCYQHMEAATKELKASGRFGRSKSILDFRRAILYNYNGYSFDGETRVINPHTLMHLLKHQNFDDQAFDLDMPDKQVKMIKDNDLTFDLFSGHQYVTRTENVIDVVDPLPVLPYLLQSGYLTVRRIRPMKGETHLMLRIPSHETRKQLFLRLLAHGRKKETLDILRGRIAMVYRALKSRSVAAIETAFKVLMASVHKPMYVSEQDYFNKDLYLAMRMLFQPMDFDDPRQDGVIDGAIDFPGGNVYIVELRSADREWIPLDQEPFIDGDVRKIAPPWQLPAQLRLIETHERFEPFWVQVNAFLDLQAQRAIQEITDRQYPERFFPYITPTTHVFKVGVAIYQRMKIRVIVEEARRKPLRVAAK